MTTEEIKAIQEIQGTGGFRVIQSLAQQKIDKADSVRRINKEGMVAEQALARQLVVELLTEFLEEINLQSSNREAKRTYE